MTKRLPVRPAPGPLEGYAARFDDLFRARAQREGFRRYLEGLLLPTERNKTLTALANTEPAAGAQRKEAQSLQWFLSESGWDPEEVNERRLELLFEDLSTAASDRGVLVIDEHGDRKWGKHTAHVGRQWLANIGKTDNGVVSVSSLWADEGAYYPLEVEPYTPARHFEGGKGDPEFRTKLEIARQLVERSVAEGVLFRAVVADSFYGEDRGFKRSLGELGVAYVLSLKKSHCWWHVEGTVGALWEAAMAASEAWKDAEESGGWTKVARTFRDGHREEWWALEVEAGPYGTRRAKRALVVTADPEGLPDLATWYLTTNLPAPGSERGNEEGALAPASVAEVVRLYGLRMWVEQSYKQVKHALGFSDYQVRSDHAIRRHWQLACCAFSFCWWAYGRLPTDEPTERKNEVPVESAGRGKKQDPEILAGGAQGGKGVAGTVGDASALLGGVLRSAAATGAKSAARAGVLGARALPLCPLATNYR
ncbi:MAG: IS701 family transposase [Actinomycetota bacterium]|nr:IS701 family transposase [Actinomycetota bacterium]